MQEVQGLFYLLDTGAQNLDAAFGGIALLENAQLTQVDALATKLTNVVSGGLLFKDNPKLERLPAFSRLLFIDTFTVSGNAELATLSLDFPREVTNFEVFQSVRSGMLRIRCSTLLPKARLPLRARHRVTITRPYCSSHMMP